MSPPSTLIGLLAPNEAWTELVSTALTQSGYRCASFRQAQSLATFMRLTPVPILLLDPDQRDLPILSAASYFRATRAAFPLFRMIAITFANSNFHRPFLATGLDAVVRKPAGYKSLLRQVDIQREALQLPDPQAPQPSRSKKTDNVITLFQS